MLKLSLSIGAALAVAAFAAPSQAVTVLSTFGPIDPGSPNETLIADFNVGSSLANGVFLTGDYRFATGTVKNDHAAPAGDTSQYLYVSSAVPSGSATLSFIDMSSVSFYWGSIDNYNSVDLGLSDGTTFHYNGIQLPPADGNQGAGATNRRVFFDAGTGPFIQSITFNSSGIAFELDDVYGKLASDSNPGGGGTVPEPASWALMIAGFGMIGVASRRRNRVTSVTA